MPRSEASSGSTRRPASASRSPATAYAAALRDTRRQLPSQWGTYFASGSGHTFVATPSPLYRDVGGRRAEHVRRQPRQRQRLERGPGAGTPRRRPRARSPPARPRDPTARSACAPRLSRGAGRIRFGEALEPVALTHRCHRARLRSPAAHPPPRPDGYDHPASTRPSRSTRRSGRWATSRAPIEELTEGIFRGDKSQTLLGATGTGKTFSHRERHQEHRQADARLLAQQDARGAALRRAPAVLPQQRLSSFSSRTTTTISPRPTSSRPTRTSRRTWRSTRRSTACASARRAPS